MQKDHESSNWRLQERNGEGDRGRWLAWNQNGEESAVRCMADDDEANN